MVGEASPLVSVTIVTFNSARHIAACLESVRAQDYSPLELVIADNASSDNSAELVRKLAADGQLIFNPVNVGFAAAQNQAITLAKGEWILCLNPDVVLSANFIRVLIAAGRQDEKVGSLCGKLLRWQPGASPERTNVIDSTGMYFLPNLRHLDRGAEEEDRGQFDETEYVFGVSGAAALYRREMVQDASIEGQFFDEEFFSYREDADLAWRAQLLGWRAAYVPAAVGWHVRRVTPERREQLPAEINWHSVKNRYLMRYKNIGFGLWWRTLLPAIARDILIFGYALLRNWKLFSALTYRALHFKSVSRKRKAIQSRRRVSDRELAQWFHWRPASQPFPAGAAHDLKN